MQQLPNGLRIVEASLCVAIHWGPAYVAHTGRTRGAFRVHHRRGAHLWYVLWELPTACGTYFGRTLKGIDTYARLNAGSLRNATVQGFRSARIRRRARVGNSADDTICSASVLIGGL